MEEKVMKNIAKIVMVLMVCVFGGQLYSAATAPASCLTSGAHTYVNILDKKYDRKNSVAIGGNSGVNMKKYVSYNSQGGGITYIVALPVSGGVMVVSIHFAAIESSTGVIITVKGSPTDVEGYVKGIVNCFITYGKGTMLYEFFTNNAFITRQINGIDLYE